MGLLPTNTTDIDENLFLTHNYTPNTYYLQTLFIKPIKNVIIKI